MSAGPDASVAGVPRIPGYRLLERIGQGGSAVVYRGEGDDELARPFAIKLFPPGDDGRVAPEYERELSTLRAIDEVRRAAGSRDIVEVVGAGEAEGYGYVVMEYVEGGTLEERLRVNGPLPASDAVGLLRPVLRALGLLHAQGLLHKDVKPANVLVGDDGHPRLGDFGLARTFDAPVSAAGTPGFCAPELYPGAAIAAGPALDVYSAAATLYYLVTGQAPLPGRPDLFALERAAVDRDLQAILFAALAEDPAARTPSAEALEAALAAWAAGDPGEPAEAVPPTRPAVWITATAALCLIGVLLVAAWRTGAGAPPLWDGVWLQPRGPRVAWTDAGEVQLAGGSAQALSDRPVAVGFDPRGTRLAAIGRWGETVAVDLRGGAPEVLFRRGARSGEGAPPLCAVAIDGRYLAWMVSVRADGPDRLEVYDLEAGGVWVAREDVPAASALAVHAPEGAAPTVYLGTPDGRLLQLRGAELGERRTIRTHADEVLAVAAVGAELLVVGDDRALQPVAGLGEGDVVLPGKQLGLARAPRPVLKIYALPLGPEPTPRETLPAERPVSRALLGAAR